MSFQIWKRASTPSAGPRAESVSSDALAPALVTAGAKRLAPLAGLLASVTLAFAVLDRVQLPLGAFTRGSQLLWLMGVVSSLGLSLSVAWISSREMMAPEKILDLGLLYEVATGLSLSILFHSVPYPAGVAPRGWSGVAVWILAYPLIIPNTRRKVIVTTLLTAAMDPLGLALHVFAGAPRPAPEAYWMFFPTLVAAFVAIFIHRIVYQITLDAGKGLDMGSYHLEELLGRGGMGEVWRASHRLLARSSAIKLIRPDSLGSGGADVLKRFEREAQATAALRSPHTVEIYDFGTTEGGTFYYVMELLEGYDSETLVHAFGPLPPERVISLLRQVCKSLAEAHERGMIHRDIKPANIYVCRYGLEHDFVKVLDFGLVKSSLPIGGHVSALTAAGIVAGTAEYISPEMARGDATVDARADLYALGCVAYWLLTGKLVFEGATPMEILIEHVKTRPTPPSQKASQPIPAKLEEIILGCLQKDPENRPQSAQELEKLLASVPLSTPWTEEHAQRWWREHPPEQAPRRWVKPASEASAVEKPSPIRAAG
jgi:eukaryotic-like serine/threonine-protein kinase